MNLDVKTWVEGEGIYQEIDILGEKRREFINVMAAQKEKAIREYLISIGWTPPNDNSSVG